MKYLENVLSVTFKSDEKNILTYVRDVESERKCIIFECKPESINESLHYEVLFNGNRRVKIFYPIVVEYFK